MQEVGDVMVAAAGTEVLDMVYRPSTDCDSLGAATYCLLHTYFTL